MKVNGKTIPEPQIELVVIPRGDEKLIFQAKMVRDYTEFDALCPRPKPKVRVYPNGKRETDTSSDSYRKEVQAYAERKNAWLFIQSLSATEGIEWSTVIADDPTTWTGYYKELEDAGLSDIEIGSIMDIVIKANALSPTRIEEATKSFLAMRQLEEQLANYPVDELQSTSSGEYVNDSE